MFPQLNREQDFIFDIGFFFETIHGFPTISRTDMLLQKYLLKMAFAKVLNDKIDTGGHCS